MVQTVCEGFQQTTTFAASSKELKSLSICLNNVDVTFLLIWTDLLLSIFNVLFPVHKASA